MSNSPEYGCVISALQSLLATVPSTSERLSADPVARARQIVLSASTKAAIVSGSLSLPPGPVGMLTILPDLISIYGVQAQMAADIAGAFGKHATLDAAQMLYCLFRHGAAHAVRDLVVRTGQRVLVKRATLRLVQQVLKRVGIKVTQKLLGRGIARWVPIVGAVGVGAYAYWDTQQVGKTAIELFQNDIRFAR